MQKAYKSGGGGSGSGGLPPKRGRPFGSTTGGAAFRESTVSAAVAGDSASPASLGVPCLLAITSLAEQTNKRMVIALQSGLKTEMVWALNMLSVLSFREKDDFRRDATPLTKVPGLLDAVLQVIDDWRDIAFPRDPTKPARIRTLGENCSITGFGDECVATGSSNLPLPGVGSSKKEDSALKRRREITNLFDDDGLFNLDDEGRIEKQQCAVLASNIVRNFSFMPENEAIMVQSRHCLETVFQCLEDQHRGDDELVTNMLETAVNLAPLLDLKIFSSSKPSFVNMTGERALQSVIEMLRVPIRFWFCAAAEVLGRMLINPDNERFLLAAVPQIYRRLVDLLSMPGFDAQAAAVSTLYNLLEMNTDCRLKLAGDRWAVDRLVKIARSTQIMLEISRKAAAILECLVLEPQNRAALLVHESAFTDAVTTDGRYSDTFARILYELTARPSHRMSSGHAVWGNAT